MILGLSTKCSRADLSKLLGHLSICKLWKRDTTAEKNRKASLTRSPLLWTPSTHHRRAGTRQDPAQTLLQHWPCFTASYRHAGLKSTFWAFFPPFSSSELALQRGKRIHQQTCSALQSHWLSGGGSATCSHRCRGLRWAVGMPERVRVAWSSLYAQKGVPTDQTDHLSWFTWGWFDSSIHWPKHSASCFKKVKIRH